MLNNLRFPFTQRPQQLYIYQRVLLAFLVCLVLCFLQACTSKTEHIPTSIPNITAPDHPITLPNNYNKPPRHVAPIKTNNSTWMPVAWADIPGWNEDNISQAWEAWIRSCAQISVAWAQECGQIIHLSQGTENQRRQWMYDHLQPYRIEAHDGKKEGLLTAYYEPIFRARRLPTGEFKYPIYYPPIGLHTTKPYWNRKQIETYPKVKNALKKHIFAYLSDPLDVLILHIQGSGQLIITEPDGYTHRVRAAYAASNNHRYASVGRYLLNKKLISDATWPGIKTWMDQHPKRVNEVLWSNPRYIFFNEVELEDPSLGPVGAQGVPLTSGRSIAVDPRSIPYGTPVWIATEDATGLTQTMQKLVLAQDTGSAITGAVRADYFWGQGPIAGEEAGRTKQTLYMWAFLPIKKH